ncbi:uncharacterized protein LOC129228211 [Uloborus diversus]|uniref:uncharacterized protein LOC129228211 n=1 Tax=Uloborus diversus TaxID=327109 RepID=UPI00240A55BE|nr:uncharacterized protein LOC129228211 [Uloborus diversus]
MALVTVQRSPCGANSNSSSYSPSTDDIDGSSNKEDDEKAQVAEGISECYFAVKGAALVLPHDECLHVHRSTIANGACDIQQHLQAMLYLLHADDILKMAVKLESIHGGRTRYLVVVSHTGRLQTEESCLLGIDCNKETTIGLVLPVWADTRITLDGDGGFSVTSSGRHHIFKPVSVQAMWSALQTLHKASSKAREYNYFKCGGTHHWVDYYEKRIESDRSCLNEWHAMDDIESRRPPSPDTVRLQPTEREETERHIRMKLKELMMSVDLDEVTSKYIRTRLEEILDIDLKEYKSFIDQEMLTILGQMDAPTEIFQYLYLGSEWNASNLEELVINGIGHILNVTREIDNFFPGMFDYQNIRVYDDESTEILHYWDRTYRYIRRAKDEGSKVLVHCKMGISRSASVVIAYVMKAYDWNLQRALEFVKTKRGCIKPNSGFLKQLEIYQGILDASKQRHNSLWRSKSETNLKSSSKPKKKLDDKKSKMREKSESLHHLRACNPIPTRPKSWSPNDVVADILFPPQSSLTPDLCGSKKISRIGQEKSSKCSLNLSDNISVSALSSDLLHCRPKNYSESSKSTEILNVDSTIPRVSSIKDRINELELQVISTSDKLTKSEVKSPTSQNRSGFVFNLANQFESGSKPSSPVDEGLVMKQLPDDEIVEPVLSQTKLPACKHHAVLVKPSLWPDESVSSDPLHFNEPKASVHPISSSTFESKNKISFADSSLSKKLSAEPCDIQSAQRLQPSEGSQNLFKTSQSAFKPFDACTSPPKGSLNEKVSNQPSTFSCCQNTRFPNLERKMIDKSSVLNLEKSSKYSNIKETNQIMEAIPFVKSTVRNQEGTSFVQNTKPPIRAPIIGCTSKNDTFNIQPKSNHFYDKEDIPFTPGKVMRTKQKIEEKNLTRTTSFDSGFPLQTSSVPSTPPESELGIGKLIRRSHSLRNDCRPSVPFCGKWYPLPALASTIPQSFKTLTEHRFNPQDNSMVLSVSTPSVVEAVNKVICGTQEILTSAIHFMPSEKVSSSSDSDFDFGSASSLPDIGTKEIAYASKIPPTQSESPVPGLVRQQREILENKVIKTITEKCNTESTKLRKEASKIMSSEQEGNLVPSDASKQEDIKESGIVKRLKKELEAKSSSECVKRDKTTEFEDLDLPESKSLTSVLPTVDRKISHLNCEATSENIASLVHPLSSSLENKTTFDQQKAPPTPHRKTSLDFTLLQRKLPLSIKFGTPPTIPPIKPNSRTNKLECKRSYEAPITECECSLLKLPAKTHTCISEIPPPPPLPIGLPKKVRKQQGSTHPLSKLIRQRHPNPLYNTM